MDREQWLEERRKGVGGSDSPVIAGVNPYKSVKELWAEKLGLTSEVKATAPMKRGTALEPIIAKQYRQATGRKLKRVKAIQKHPNPQYSWMLANIDRLVQDDERGLGVLEIKAPGLRQYGNIERNGPRDIDMVQMQHYLAVMGLMWASFCAMNAERWEMVFYDVERDEGLINEIIARGANFWDMVQQQIEPTEEAPPIVDLPAADGKVITMDSPEWSAAVEQLRTARELKGEVDALEQDAKLKITSLMNGGEIAESEGFRVYYREQAGRKTFDKKALAKAHPEIDLSEYEKQGKPFRSFKPYFLRGEEL